MDCQDINNKSSNSIPETLDLHYMSIIRTVTIILTTPSTPPRPSPSQKSLYFIYIYFLIFPIISVWFILEIDTTLTSIFIKI